MEGRRQQPEDEEVNKLRSLKFSSDVQNARKQPQVTEIETVSNMKYVSEDCYNHRSI